jgi:hypothetical protein
MNQFDPRIVIVGIEINGQLKTYEGLSISASGEKYANPLQNEATVQIFNLDKSTRDYLLTETSPYNWNRRRKRLTLDVGRESIGTFRLFTGDIIQATVSQPPDIGMSIKARTANFFKGDVLSKSHPMTNLSVIARGVANDLGLKLVFEATDKKISNYCFSGASVKQIDKLEEAGNVDAFIDDDFLIVKNRNEPLSNVTHVLSEESGMVGIPEITERGIKVSLLLVPSVRLGGRFTLNSKMYSALNGDYVIYKLGFSVTNRDTDFYWIAECARRGAIFLKPGAIFV